MLGKVAVALAAHSTAKPGLKERTAQPIQAHRVRKVAAFSPTNSRRSSWLKKSNTTLRITPAQRRRLALLRGFAIVVVRKLITSCRRAQGQRALLQTFT